MADIFLNVSDSVQKDKEHVLFNLNPAEKSYLREIDRVRRINQL